MTQSNHQTIRPLICRIYSSLIVFLAVALFATVSLAQTSGGGQVGGSNLLVPINPDDPYTYNKNVVTNIVADLFGEQFSFSNSMLWIGEHVNEDPAQSRILGLTNHISGHNAEEVGIDKNVIYSEIERFSAPWLGYTTSSGVSSVEGIPYSYEIEEYGEVVSGWLDNSEGVSRLVVGAVLVLHYEVLNPAGERADMYFERLYPIKRFYNEGQATGYAEDMANEIDSTIDLLTGESDCASLPAGNERSLCFCLNTIEINYGNAKTSCLRT